MCRKLLTLNLDCIINMFKYKEQLARFTNIGSYFIMVWLAIAAIIEYNFPGVVATAIPAWAFILLVLIIIFSAYV